MLMILYLNPTPLAKHCVQVAENTTQKCSEKNDKEIFAISLEETKMEKIRKILSFDHLIRLAHEHSATI